MRMSGPKADSKPEQPDLLILPGVRTLPKVGNPQKIPASPQVGNGNSYDSGGEIPTGGKVICGNGKFTI
jgi:hypothetical protein